MMPHDPDDYKLKRALERHPYVVEIAHAREWNGRTICDLQGRDKERVIRFFQDTYNTNPTTIQMLFALQRICKLTKDFAPWAMTDADGKADGIYKVVSEVLKYNSKTTKEQRMCLLALMAICQRRGQVIEQLTK